MIEKKKTKKCLFFGFLFNFAFGIKNLNYKKIEAMLTFSENQIHKIGRRYFPSNEAFLNKIVHGVSLIYLYSNKTAQNHEFGVFKDIYNNPVKGLTQEQVSDIADVLKDTINDPLWMGLVKKWFRLKQALNRIEKKGIRNRKSDILSADTGVLYYTLVKNEGSLSIYKSSLNALMNQTDSEWEAQQKRLDDPEEIKKFIDMLNSL